MSRAQETFTLSSPAFKQGEAIPTKYTCEGEDINPPLLIKNIPAGTKSLALIVDDPDAPMGTWVHWVVFNIPLTTNSISENLFTAARARRQVFIAIFLNFMPLI